MTQNELKHIALSDIRPNPDALRAVNTETAEFKEMVDSVRAHGVLNSINVREKEVDGATIYEVIDGLHRYTASKVAGRETIPAQVLDISNAEVWEAQIIGNIHRIETRAHEYSEHLLRILGANPAWTLADLAAKVNKSPQWVGERLRLLKLKPEIGEMVNEEVIPLTNAYALSKLPLEEQDEYLERAQTMDSKEFTGLVAARVKAIREAARKGKSAEAPTFVPVPHGRKIGEVKDELEAMDSVAKLVQGMTDPVDAARAALKWFLHLDDVSVEAQRAKWDADQASKAENAKKRTAERAIKSKADADKKLEEARAAGVDVDALTAPK